MSIYTILAVMTGAEIIIAIVGIVAGFATCAQYATQVIEKIKRKRLLARAKRQAELLQAELLGCSLRDSESAIRDELRRLNTIGLGRGMSWCSIVYSKG